MNNVPGLAFYKSEIDGTKWLDERLYESEAQARAVFAECGRTFWDYWPLPQFLNRIYEEQKGRVRT
jgi:hypothetical protein